MRWGIQREGGRYTLIKFGFLKGVVVTRRIPNDPSTISEPQNLPIGEFHVVQEQRLRLFNCERAGRDPILTCTRQKLKVIKPLFQ